MARSGKVGRLDAYQVDWDRAFFSEGRGDEPWAERWRGLTEEARTWQ